MKILSKTQTRKIARSGDKTRANRSSANRVSLRSSSLSRASALGRLASDNAWLIFVVLLINVLGSLMVLSASSIESILQYGSPWAVFEHQVIWLILGTICFLVASRVDYALWRKLSPLLLCVSAFLLLVVLVPGIGLHASGSSRWVGAGPLKLQPSELAKLALVIFGADLLTRRQNSIDDWRKSTRPTVVIFGIFAILVMAQPDMGTTMIMCISLMCLLYLAGISRKQLFYISGGLVVGAVIFGIAEPYRRERLTSFLHPFAQSSTGGYQVVQSLSALGSGHIMGVGLGASKAKWGFLPNSYTDFIFSIIGEELGLIGTIVVVLLFVCLAIIGVRIAMKCPDRFGKLLAGGIVGWITAQAIINMGAVIGILPVTGIPLPFISYGGSSLVFAMIAMGILSSISTRSQNTPAPLSLVHLSSDPRHVKRAKANIDHRRNSKRNSLDL